MSHLPERLTEGLANALTPTLSHSFGDENINWSGGEPAEGYANLLNYQQWVEFETNVILKVEDAVPLIGAYLG
jgi:hypothetical protein